MDILRDAKGFTLLEIISTLVILSILSYVAMGKLPHNENNLISIESALRSHIRYAQAKSMGHAQELWGIQMDTASHEYWLVKVQADDQGQLSWGGEEIQPPGLGATKIGINGDRVSTRALDVTLASQAPKFTLLFDDMGRPLFTTSAPNGSPPPPLSAPFSIDLLDGGGHSKSISIQAETGFIP